MKTSASEGVRPDGVAASDRLPWGMVGSAARLARQAAFGNMHSYRENRAMKRLTVPREVRTLRRAGWVRYQGVVPDAVLRRIGEVIDQRVTDPRCSMAGGDAPRADSVRIVTDIDDILPELRQVVVPAVRSTVEAYYGSAFEVEIARLYRTVNVTDEEARFNVMGNFFHLDPEPMPTLKYFVQISPATRQSAFRLLPVPVTKRIMRSGFLYPGRAVGPARRSLASEAGAVVFDDEPGSAILCNTQVVLHRAGIPGPGEHRDLLQLRLRPSSLPLSPDWVPLAVDD